jgi:hypothetical protein
MSRSTPRPAPARADRRRIGRWREAKHPPSLPSGAVSGKHRGYRAHRLPPEKFNIANGLWEKILAKNPLGLCLSHEKIEL